MAFNRRKSDLAKYFLSSDYSMRMGKLPRRSTRSFLQGGGLCQKFTSTMFVHVLLFVVVGLISKYTQLVQFLYLFRSIHITSFNDTSYIE